MSLPLFIIWVGVITCLGLLGLWLLDLVARLARKPQEGLLGWLFGGRVLDWGAVRMWRRATQRIVVGQVATIVRQNLPLATALALAADSERGRARTYLRWISSFLAQGLPLSEAMRLGFPDCSGLVLSLVIAGEKAGQLPAALEQAEQYLIERDRRRERLDVSFWAYPVVLLCATGLIVSGIMIAIIPKYMEIFADFGAKLPGLTIALIDLSRWFVQGTPPGWIVVFASILIVGYFCLRRRRFPDPALTTRIADWIRWHVPGLRRLEFGEGMSAMLSTLRFAVGGGIDLGAGARLAAELDVNTQLRGRMRRFADLLTQGTSAGKASQAAGLGQVATTALVSGQRAGDMDAALRYAADYHDAIVSRWWIVLGNLAWPLSTLAIATVVAGVVLALFLPLVALIDSVSS